MLTVVRLLVFAVPNETFVKAEARGHIRDTNRLHEVIVGTRYKMRKWNVYYSFGPEPDAPVSVLAFSKEEALIEACENWGCCKENVMNHINKFPEGVDSPDGWIYGLFRVKETPLL